MRFPIGCVVWSLIVALIVGGLGAVVVYAHTFGYVKSILWLVAFLLTFAVSVLCVEPIKALLEAGWLTVCRRPDTTTDAAPPPPLADKWTQYQRQYAAFVASGQQRPDVPVSRAVNGAGASSGVESLRQRRLREKYRQYYGTLTSDLLMFGLYLVTLLLVVLGTRDRMAYYSHRLAIEQLVDGRYVRGPHRPVRDEAQFWAYVTEVLVPTIHPDEYAPQLRNTGWLRGKTAKLVGVARLRQHRVRTICDPHSAATPLADLVVVDCARHFEASAQERRPFAVGWSPFVADQPYQTVFRRLTEPWLYRSAWQAQSLAVYGEDGLYDGGGYILQLGRTLANTRAILRQARRTGWLDRRTSAVIIELTLYSAQSNLFNVITICAERTPLGTYTLTPTVHTVRLLLVLESLSIWALLLAIAFVVCTLAFAVRLGARLVQHYDAGSAGRWLRQPWNAVDTLVVLLSVGALGLFGWRDRYVGRLLDRLAAERNNAYVSFAYAVLADRLLTGWSALLVAVATVRLWKVLQFVRVFRVISGTLRRAAPSLAQMMLAALVLMIALSLATSQLNGQHTRTFNTVGRSVAALSVLAFGFANEDRIGVQALMHGGSAAGTVLLVGLTVTVYVVLLNMFMTIVCQYFKETQQRDEAERAEMVPFGYGAWLMEEGRLAAAGWRRVVRRWRCCGNDRRVADDGDDRWEERCDDGGSVFEQVIRAEARMELLNVQLHLVGEVVMTMERS